MPRAHPSAGWAALSEGGMRWFVILAVVACGSAGGKHGRDSGAPVTTPSGTTPAGPSGGTPGGTTPGTGTATGSGTATGGYTSPPLPCDVDPELSLRVTTAPGRQAGLVEVTVTPDAPAAVAVRCQSRTDLGDVHLVETAEADAHAVPLTGLLGGHTYDCLAAAVCPASASPTPFSVTVAPYPALPALDVAIDARLGQAQPYTVFNRKQGGGCAEDAQFLVVDERGRYRFWHDLPLYTGIDVEVELHDGRFVVGGGQHAPLFVDVWGGETHRVPVALDGVIFHHDGKQLDDGRILVLEEHTVRADELPFTGFGLHIVDPDTGAVAWSFDSQDAVDAGTLDPLSADGDVWHANWADVVWEDGHPYAYVSLCFPSWVLKIDVATNAVVWTFGVGGDFVLDDVSGAPLGDDDFPQCQHGLEVEGDRILVYDNGQWRGESRATEYRVDPATGVATRLWTWTDGWFEATLGDIDHLPDGRVLVTQGHPECWSDGRNTSIVEVDPLTGIVASRITLRRDHEATYRADRIGGCELFNRVGACPPLQDRLTALAPVFDGCGAEVCNGLDDDCDGAVDEGFDADSDGYAACAGDCDDGDAGVHPGAIERCNSGDDDCDGEVDEGCAP